jgi:predicted phosphate transport protein (TIGR00153 family)
MPVVTTPVAPLAAPRRNAVRFRLTPHATGFYDLFTRSADNLVAGVELLKELLGASLDERAGIAARMRDTEHVGDEVTHEIMRAINSTFVTPFDREDIYRLASNLDDVMDHMDAAVDLVALYAPAELPPELADQVEVLERAAQVTAAAMPRLRSMTDLEEYWIEVNRLENAADHIHRRLLARLFGGEFDPMTVLKLKDIVEELEAAADAFEHVANIVETIAVKES